MMMLMPAAAFLFMMMSMVMVLMPAAALFSMIMFMLMEVFLILQYLFSHSDTLLIHYYI